MQYSMSPASGPEDAEQHADQGGLAGPVRPEQGEDFALAHRERHAGHGPDARVGLGHVPDGEDRHANSGGLLSLAGRRIRISPSPSATRSPR